MTQIRSHYLLLADDDPDDQELFSEPFLEENPGAKIVFMNDGQAVVDFLKNNDNWPCVMMLDYKMPKLNGSEVLIAIEKDEHFKNVHKIVWSTSDNPDYVGRCMRHGANRYFKKPNSIEELNALVRYLTEVYRSFCKS